MASLTSNGSSLQSLGSPLNGKSQDGPYQIELEDIESDETGNTNTASPTTTGSSKNVLAAAAAPSSSKGLGASPMKPEAHYTTGFTGTGVSDGENLPSRSSTYAVRACVCAFAILLLWITSLNLSKVFVTSSIRAPETQTVVKSWDNLFDFVRSANAAYSTCADLQITRCNSSLFRDTGVMLDNIRINSELNKATITAAQFVATTCSSLTVELSTSIKLWKDNHALDQIQYNTSKCTQSEIDEIKVWVDRPDLIRNPAYVLAGTYSKLADARTQRMLNIARNFSDYNYNYFLGGVSLGGTFAGDLGNLVPGYKDAFGNITDGLLAPATRLYNCMSMAEDADLQCDNGARAAWEAGSRPVQEAYVRTRARLVQTRDQYTAVTSAMTSLLGAIKSFFDEFLRPASEGLGKLGIDIGAFPSTSFGVPLPPSLPDNVEWFDPSLTVLNVSAHFAEMNDAIRRAGLGSRLLADDWFNNQTTLAGIMPDYFDDYNPPPLVDPMQAEVDQQAQDSADFRQQSAYALNQQPEPEVRNSTVKLVKGFLADQAQALSATDFKFEPLSGNLLLRPLLDVIPSLYLFALAIDYIWRAYRSVRLIIKYWFQSAVGLPVIDVRDYENHAGARGPVKAVTVATHPGTIVTVIIIVAILALTAIIPPYSSILDAYVQGCVKSQEGTVITNNTFSIAFNYVQSDGNKKLNEGFQSLDASRNEICGQNLQKTTDASNADLSLLEQANSAHDDNARQTQLIYKCIDFTNMGSREGFNASSGGHGARHPMTIIEDALSLTNASDYTKPCMSNALSHFVLLPAVFNCSAIPPCKQNCEATRETVAKQSYDAGCRTEYLVHSFIARFWVTLLVFISLNISRMLFMAAVVRLGWRSLTPRGFEFVSNCTRIGETSKTINAQLVVALNKAIVNYERFAIFLFGLAILIHVPYIVVLATINQQIEYK